MRIPSGKALCCVLSAALLLTAAAVPATALPVPESSAVASTVKQDGYSTIVGKLRVQTLSDTLARVEVEGPKGFEDRETYHITGRDWQGVSSQTVQKDGETQIVTDYYTVHIPEGAESLEGVYVTDAAGRTIWNYTELPDNNQYLPEPGNTPAAWAIADNPRVVPSEWGYDYLPEGEEDNGLNGWDAENNAPDMYIFMPQGSAKQLRQDFVDLTGSAELVPLKALGLWHSCFYAYNEETALAEMQKYRDEGFPLDNFVMDTDWRVGGSHGYDINTNLFPDMERFLERAHTEQNVRITFNDHPEAQNDQNVLEQPELTYRNNNLRRLLNMGLDTWWFDRNWSVSIKSPFEGIPKESIGMYPYQYITEKVTPDERPLIIGNVDGIYSGQMQYPPNLSSHRYSIQWTGDIMQTDAALKQEIEAAVRSGAITGVPYVSADVGGHYGKNSPDQWTRWSQYAAFSPIFRYHSVSGDVNRAPWLYGEEAEDIAREYVKMRYRLMPVFYSAARKAYDTGLPITQRLDYNYPQYAESQDNTTYTIGDSILVAPIWEAGDREVIPAAWFSTKQGQGLKAEYFNNSADDHIENTDKDKGLTGTPVLTRTDSQIDFDWDYGSPAEGVNQDYFSARWTGKITIGDEDARLSVTSDDGVRIWVDGKLEIDQWRASNNETAMGTTVYEAGSVHDIKVEYYEGSGGAKIKLEAISMAPEGDSREVFIPDGRWIDVWTGKAYEGPQTITVTHKLDTSPIFVRSGSILPLVDGEVEYVDEKPWDKVTLDVYPSTQLDGTAQLYEDDQTSVGYRTDEYRTTDLSTTYDEKTGETVVKVGKASGSFDGSDAFDSRTWTVRVHGLSDWGEVTAATVDGKTVSAKKIEKTADASPFAISGGALDGDIYEITFEKALNAESEVRVKFATPQDETLPDADKAAVSFTADQKAVRPNIDLTASGCYDWTQYGSTDASSVVSKATGEDVIGQLDVDGSASVIQGNTTYRWSDGEPVAKGDTQNGLALSDGSFSLAIKAGKETRRVSLYIGADDAVGRLELTGGATAQLIEVDGVNSSLYQRIVIDMSAADENGELRIVYRKTDGDGSISLMGVTVGDPSEDEKMKVLGIADMADVSGETNLTSDLVKDWVHLGLGGDTKAVNRKKDVQQLLTAPVYTGSLMSVEDYPPISFSDGTPTLSASRSPNAVTAYQGSITISAPSTGEWQELKVYHGGYQTTNTIEITDETGATIAQQSYTVTETQRKVTTVRFRSEADSTLNFKISGNGHVFVAAYTLADLKEAPDQDIVDAAKATAEETLAALKVSNDTTAAGIRNAVKKALPSGVEVSWKDAFQLKPATSETPGSITGSLALTFGNASAVVEVELTIERLADPDQEAVDAAKAAAEKALAALKATNDTTADDILQAVTNAVDNENVVIAWKDPFQKTPAAGDTSGSITGSLSLTVGEASAVVEMELTIDPIGGEIVQGDLDKDGKVTIADVMEACKILARKSADIDPTASEIARGDLDGDKDVTIADVMEICKLLARNA